MPEINYVDAALKKLNQDTEISIQIGLGGFSFLIYTSNDGIPRAFRYYPFENTFLTEDLLNQVAVILEKDELIKLPHKRAIVCYLSRQSTLIPEEYFDKENLKSFLDFNQPMDDLDELHFHKIKELHANLVFTIPSYFAGLITNQFKNCVFLNQGVSLLNYICFLHHRKNALQLCININKDFFDVVIMLEKELLLYNTFPFSSETDFLYFVLYVINQLKLDKNSIDYIITGEGNARKSLLNMLATQLPVKNFLTPETERFALPHELHELQTGRFNTLLNLKQCV